MLSTLEGEGWTLVQAPRKDDESNVIGRYDGEPIKTGVMIEKVKQTEFEERTVFRSGKYNLEVWLDFDIGRARVQVERAEGYE